MIRPTILYKGEEYPVFSVTWNEGEGLLHATFEDKNGKHHIAFQKLSFEDEGYSEAGTLQLDLEKRLKWGEAVASGSHLD